MSLTEEYYTGQAPQRKATSHDNVTDIERRLRKLSMRDSNPAFYTDLEKTAFDAASTIATLRKQLENARSEALEEAAVRVGELFGIDNHVCDAIRLLKGQPC